MGSEQIRCPVGPKRLLAILRTQGRSPSYVDDGTLVEFACSDCARDLRKQGYDVARVLHQYNIAGELVNTVQVPKGMTPSRENSDDV